jgi:Flp pilus assembly CpaF family ATPase
VIDDQDLVRKVRDRAAEALVARRQEARESGSVTRAVDEEVAIRAACAGALDQEASSRLLSGRMTLDIDSERRITKRIVDELLGMGPLQELLEDPEITDIHVRGTSPVWIKKTDGSRVEIPAIVGHPEELVALVRNAASRSTRGERRFDASTVECNLCLEDGSRLFAIMDVSSTPSLVIRKHQFGLASLNDLQDTGLFDSNISAFFRSAVRARRNIVIAGGTGSGKTTLLRALLNEVPREERIVTIEDAYELGIDRFEHLHPDHDALQSRPPNVEGHGGIPLSDLTRMALRMDPDRVVVGEVRGAEAFPMLMAMSQGNNGSMCTIHADSSRSVFPKLAAYVSMAQTGLPVDIVNLVIASAVHLVVHIEVRHRQRRITSVCEVVDADGPRIISNEIFKSAPDGELESAFPMTADLRELLDGFGYGSPRDLHRYPVVA